MVNNTAQDPQFFSSIGSSLDQNLVPTLTFLIPLIAVLLTGVVQGSAEKARFWVLMLVMSLAQIISVVLFFWLRGVILNG